jgi:hypothetical protein
MSTDMPRERRLTQESFEMLLLEIRDGASSSLTESVVGEVAHDEQHTAVIEDSRAVWHAADVALGILNLGRYFPKREALDDVRAMLALLDEGGEG